MLLLIAFATKRKPHFVLRRARRPYEKCHKGRRGIFHGNYYFAFFLHRLLFIGGRDLNKACFKRLGSKAKTVFRLNFSCVGPTPYPHLAKDSGLLFFEVPHLSIIFHKSMKCSETFFEGELLKPGNQTRYIFFFEFRLEWDYWEIVGAPSATIPMKYQNPLYQS